MREQMGHPSKSLIPNPVETSTTLALLFIKTCALQRGWGFRGKMGRPRMDDWSPFSQIAKETREAVRRYKGTGPIGSDL